MTSPEDQPEGRVETEPKVSVVDFLRREIDSRRKETESSKREDFARMTQACEFLLDFLPPDFDLELPEGTNDELYACMDEQLLRKESPRKVAMEMATLLMLRQISQRK